MEFIEMIENQKLVKRMMHPYVSAIHILKAKLGSIDEELKCRNGYSPIHMIQSRMKSMESIIDKMNRKGYPVHIESLKKLNDIAGMRVICHYMNDIQYISQLLMLHEDLVLIKQKNYIDYPKENGYRSLHLVFGVPVYNLDGVQYIPVEIQLRTIAMDCWASLEHELQYKNHDHMSLDIKRRLQECARLMAKTDEEMQKIHQQLDCMST